MSDDARRAVEAARALQAQLTRRLAAAQTTLSALEREARALEDEIGLMERSRARRAYLSIRGKVVNAAALAAHPAWAGGIAARAAASRPPLGDVLGAFRHLRWRSLPLRLSPPSAQRTDPTHEFLGIRWIGPVSIRRQVFESLLCHPASMVEYRARVRAGARFSTACAISPQVWRYLPAPVIFRVGLQVPALGWESAREIRVDTQRILDRRWHPLTIDLPARETSLEVTVTLETSVPDGNASHAWALFADPRFEWRRPASEVRHSIAAFAARARTSGVREALSAARRAPSAEEAATIYSRWVEATAPGPERLAELAAEIAALPHQPLVSIITPVYNTDPRWLRACVESVRRQVYPNWELCLCDDASPSAETAAALRELDGDPRIRIVRLARNEGISGASNAALAVATGEYVALLDHDDELTPDALAEVVRAINADPGGDVFYSDEDKLDEAGRRCDACFKPDWSPEHFEHRMYTCHFTVARRALVEEAGRFRRDYDGAQDYDLWLRMMQRTDRIVHIPKILYHWRKLPQSTASAGAAKPWAQDAGRLALQDYVARAGLDAEVLPGAAPGLFRVRRRIAGRPLVSIVIPTAGRLREVRGQQQDLLAQAIRSVVQRTEWPEWELVIVADAAGLQPTSLEALRGTRHRVLSLPAEGPFNFSRKINAGVSASEGTHLLLFNDDLEAIEPGWMSAMLEYSQDPAIGAVGAQLLYPDGRLQHVGMLLGVAGIAAHAYHQHPGPTPGYFGSVIGPRNYSAVTAACLMTRRAVFDEAGGFDEAFPIDFNDVDYCLRVRRAGYRIVYTPHARLYHHESASFGARQQDQAGIDEMRRRWAGVIARDPYYNPNLTRDFPDYRLRS